MIISTEHPHCWLWTALWEDQRSSQVCAERLQLIRKLRVVQALAGELGHAKEAQRWLKEQTPWLDAAQRQTILEDLQQALQEQDSAGQQPPLQASIPAPQEDKVSWAAPDTSKVPDQHSHNVFPNTPSLEDKVSREAPQIYKVPLKHPHNGFTGTSSPDLPLSGTHEDSPQARDVQCIRHGLFGGRPMSGVRLLAAGRTASP